MSTKIFRVSYSIGEYVDGRFSDTLADSKKVVAKDGMQAAEKAKVMAEKPFSFKSDEKPKKMIKCTYKNFSVTHIELLAESD